MRKLFVKVVGWACWKALSTQERLTVEGNLIRWGDNSMSTITVVLDNQCIDFEVTHYCPRLPATRWEPEEPEELEWQASDPSIQALIDHFGLHESMEKLIVEQAERDRADAEEMSYD